MVYSLRGIIRIIFSNRKKESRIKNFYRKWESYKRGFKRYSLPLLNRYENIVSSSAFMTYSLWAAGPELGGAKSNWMLITVPFVLFGIFRYQFISDPQIAEKRISFKHFSKFRKA